MIKYVTPSASNVTVFASLSIICLLLPVFVVVVIHSQKLAAIEEYRDSKTSAPAKAVSVLFLSPSYTHTIVTTTTHVSVCLYMLKEVYYLIGIYPLFFSKKFFWLCMCEVEVSKSW